MNEEQALHLREAQMRTFSAWKRLDYSAGKCSLSELIDFLTDLSRHTPYTEVDA